VLAVEFGLRLCRRHAFEVEQLTGDQQALLDRDDQLDADLTIPAPVGVAVVLGVDLGEQQPECRTSLLDAARSST
jgi:hypothetical protein